MTFWAELIIFRFFKADNIYFFTVYPDIFSPGLFPWVLVQEQIQYADCSTRLSNVDQKSKRERGTSESMNSSPYPSLPTSPTLFTVITFEHAFLGAQLDQGWKNDNSPSIKSQTVYC